MSLACAIRSDVTCASTAETFFVGSTPHTTFSVAFARIVPGIGENFLPVSDVQTVQFSILAFHEFVTAGITIAGLVIQISHHHRKRTTGEIVDDCHDVWPHLRVAWKQVLLSRSVGHMEMRIASRMSLGNWSPVRSRCRCSQFSHAWMLCTRSSIWAASGGDKICLLSSKLLPAANGSYRAAGLLHCSRPGSRSAPRITSRASPSILEIKKCCNT